MHDSSEVSRDAAGILWLLELGVSLVPLGAQDVTTGEIEAQSVTGIIQDHKTVNCGKTLLGRGFRASVTLDAKRKQNNDKTLRGNPSQVGCGDDRQPGLGDISLVSEGSDQ